MNNVLDRLLSEDFKMWDNLIDEYERTNRSLKVPEINETAIHFLMSVLKKNTPKPFMTLVVHVGIRMQFNVF